MNIYTRTNSIHGLKANLSLLSLLSEASFKVYHLPFKRLQINVIHITAPFCNKTLSEILYRVKTDYKLADIKIQVV